MIVTDRIRMVRLLNHISRQPEYAEKIGIVLKKKCDTSNQDYIDDRLEKKGKQTQ